MLKRRKSLFFIRSNDESYSRGVLSDENYEREKKRSLVSLKVCLISWFIEFMSSLSFVTFAFMHNIGLQHHHYPDCIMTFVIIPIVFLMNDEETKGIIAEENWYQGIRHMLGIYKRVTPYEPPDRRGEENSRKSNQSRAFSK